MTTLDNKLEDFAQGKIVFEALNESVEELSSSDFSATTQFMATLSTARDSGLLDHEQYHGLLTQVISADKIDVTPPIVANDMMATQSFSTTQNTDEGWSGRAVSSKIDSSSSVCWVPVAWALCIRHVTGSRSKPRIGIRAWRLKC